MIRVFYSIDQKLAKLRARERGELPPSTTDGAIEAGDDLKLQWSSSSKNLYLSGSTINTTIAAVDEFSIEDRFDA